MEERKQQVTTDGLFKCRLCDFTTPKKTAIAQHYRWHHPKKKVAPSATKEARSAYYAAHRAKILEQKKAARASKNIHAVAKHQPTLNGVNFCPNCGCNIKAVSVAINLHQL